MVHYVLSQIMTAGHVVQMTYHRVNKNSAIQEKDDFDKYPQEDD